MAKSVEVVKGFNYRLQREDELGIYTDEQLQEAVDQYCIPVNTLLGGRRFSMISAIIDFELGLGENIL